jgi:predicted DNA binding CopG/RHH family protein
MPQTRQRKRLPAGGTPKAASRAATSGRKSSDARLRDATVSLDAEDIALARLQAHLRKAEAIQAPRTPASSADRRTTIRIPDALLSRLRERARRDGVTPSEVITQALERFLR